MDLTRIPALVLAAAFAILPAHVHAESMETETERRSDGLAIRAQLDVWNEALVKGDFDAMAHVFSDDFFESEGITREFYAEMFRQMGVKYTESSRDNTVIRFYGKTAIVAGQWTTRGTSGQFGFFSSTSQMTDLWVKQGDAWKCVAVVPDQARQAFAKIDQVHIGPDTPAEIVILFGVGVSDDEIEVFRTTHLAQDSDKPVAIKSYARVGLIEEHDVVCLKLDDSVSDSSRKFFVERLLKEPVVFRIFEDIVPSKITLGE